MSFIGNATTNKVLRGRINKLETLCVTAYEIAVKNGFEGTEAEWLESLKGRALLVTVTDNGDGTHSAEPGHAEILAAHEAGQAIFCKFELRIYQLASALPQACFFDFIDKAGEYSRIMIAPDDTAMEFTSWFTSYIRTVNGIGPDENGNIKLESTPSGTGGLSITDDGDGNVVITSTGSVSITDDGEGNVQVTASGITDDGNGNVQMISNAGVVPGGGVSGADGGYYTPVVSQPEVGKMQIDWTPSQDDMPDVEPETITWPAGPQGPQGIQGKTGPQGPQGNPGTPGADGKSAYQYALDGGYTGSEEDFAQKLAADAPSGGGSYALPIATPNTLGGVKPVSKSDDMTQSVGVDAAGGLWTAPGASDGTVSGGTWTTIHSDTLTEDVSELIIDLGDAWNEVLVRFTGRTNNDENTLNGGSSNGYVQGSGYRIMHGVSLFHARQEAVFPATLTLRKLGGNHITASYALYNGADLGSGIMTNSMVCVSELTFIKVWFADTAIRLKAGSTVEVYAR